MLSWVPMKRATWRKCFVVGSPTPGEFPVTPEQLQRACSVFQDVRNCYIRECGADNLDLIGPDFSRFIGTIAEICQEDTPLHSAFAQHMSCLKEVMSKEREELSCNIYQSKASDYLEFMWKERTRGMKKIMFLNIFNV
ncbi:hypothetical protein CEXT_35771, partial [Caerostris extrusa]